MGDLFLFVAGVYFINNPYLLLLILLLKKEYFNKYYSYININNIKENNRELYHIYNTLASLHEKHSDKDFSFDDLQTTFFLTFPDADKETYTVLFKTASEASLDEDVGEGLLQEIKQREAALKLSEEAYKVSTGLSQAEKLKEFFDQFQEPEGRSQGLEPEENDLEFLLNKAFKDPGLRWRLEFLNKSLGSIRPGDFGFIFKRPETGGTAFCASEVANMLPQAKRPVLWFNNEEMNQKVQIRVYQAYFGITIDQLASNPKKYKELFQEKIGNKFKFFGVDRCNKADIEYIVDQYDPELVIYDQLDNISGFAADRNDLLLGEIYKWARKLTKKGNGHAAIAVTQADGTAENTKWLTMQHVSEAKTTKQATADWILGMGMIHEPGTEYVRFLNISKNKLLGDEDSIPDLRHGRGEVLIKPEIMRFEDIIKYQ